MHVMRDRAEPMVIGRMGRTGKETLVGRDEASLDPASDDRVRVVIAGLKKGGLSKALVAAGMARSAFDAAIQGSSELQELYECAVQEMLVPLEDAHLKAMADSTKDSVSRRKMLEKHLPRLYAPEPAAADGAEGGITITIAAPVSAETVGMRPKEGALAPDAPAANLGAGDTLPERVGGKRK